jgi:hypothetical protein
LNGFQVSGCGLNCVKQKPAAQEIPILRNDKFKFKGKLKDKVLLALRASGMVIWNAKRLV